MNYRRLGQTDLRVSEYGFGAWGIGGDSYGPVERADALSALSVAEELGCNLVDTAAVYGESEAIIGEFLKGRRDRWILASKYSFQKEGLEKTLEQQLRRLDTDFIDFYQLHAAPPQTDEVYRQLERLKASGKVRYLGVSLYSADSIRQVLSDDRIDGFQVAFNLVDVQPCRQCQPEIAAAGKGVLIRSSLKSGLLTGKYAPGVRFDPQRDHRARDMTADEIDRTLRWLESFRFLEQTEGSLLQAAARYPLAFDSTSSVLLGARSAEQARINFGEIPARPLSPESLQRIEDTQRRLGIGRVNPLRRWAGRMLRSLRG